MTLNSFRQNDYFGDGKVTGRVPDVKIHYIESKTNLNEKRTEFRSYCVFHLREDFWIAMEAFQGYPPINLKNLKTYIPMPCKPEQAEKPILVRNQAVEAETQTEILLPKWTPNQSLRTPLKTSESKQKLRVK